MDLELRRGGGPDSAPSLSVEQQQQLEQQRAIEREQMREQQPPLVMAALNKELNEHPVLSKQLSRYDREQQDEIKRTLTEGITQQLGYRGLYLMRGVFPANDGGIGVVFNNEYCLMHLKGKDLPQPAHGTPAIPQTESPARPGPEQTERTTQQRTQTERQQTERAGHEDDYPHTEPAHYSGPLTLAQRQQQENLNTPLDASGVAEPRFEHGILAVQPIPYSNPVQPPTDQPRTDTTAS